jgi:hypothetical protein
MAGDLEITGTQQFVAVAKHLNAQGKAGRGLWKELNTAIQTAAKPMGDAVLAHLEAYLPDNYARTLRATLTIRVSRSTRGNTAGLKLVGTAKGRRKKRRVKTLDDGVLRHPVFTTDVWVDQRVKPGFWSTPLENSREIPAKEIRRAVQKTIRKLQA